jgi:hypothetical protein
MTWPYSGPVGAFPPREHAFLASSGPGEAFVRVMDTENPAMDGAPSFGNAQFLHPAATDDGLSLIFVHREQVWRLNQADGWVPFSIGERDDIMWNGASATGIFSGLDITATGGQWTSSLVLTEDGNAERAVVTGTPPNVVTLEAVWEAPVTASAWVHIDDLGETVAYAHSGPGFGEAKAFVGEQSGTVREILVDADYPTEVTLSDDGEVVHVVNAVAGMGDCLTSFFVGADDGAGRVMAHSGTFDDCLRTPQLSDDGSVYAARVDIGGNLYVAGALLGHRNIVPDGAPEASDIAFGRDEEGDLLVRARASAGGNDVVKSVRVLPLYQRYVRPAAVLEQAEDPTYGWRTGQELMAVENSAGLYETTLGLGGLGDLLDEDFSVRLVVTSGPAESAANQASFYDFFPAP